MTRWIPYIFLFVILFGWTACGSKEKRDALVQTHATTETEIYPQTLSLADSPTEKRMRDMGLVDIAEIDSAIRVHLLYATEDNFLGSILYEDIRKAFLLPEAAKKLSDARRILQAERPDLTLLVYDAARPISVQERMWKEAIKYGKTSYVANPNNGGGLHNYGAAVDLTLCNAAGVPLPMGSPYDHLGPESNIDCELDLLRTGKITQQEFDNRRLLRRVMTGAGFRTLPCEWWHFNLVSRTQAIATLQQIE
jgi:D-alanyl-D-alanine dipeptidase